VRPTIRRLSYKVINFGVCALIVALPLAYVGFTGVMPRLEGLRTFRLP
jgi:hypothetical protein